MIAKGEYLTTPSDNVFQVDWVKAGKVRLKRIGTLVDGDFIQRQGIPATVSTEWMESSIAQGYMVQCVRCIGNVFMPMDQYIQHITA